MQNSTGRCIGVASGRRIGSEPIVVIGADPPGFEGLAQLFRLIHGNHYRPFWARVSKGVPWEIDPFWRKKKIKTYRRKNKTTYRAVAPDKRTKRFGRLQAKYIRDLKDSNYKKYGKKYIAEITRDLKKYYRVPQKLIDKYWQNRLGWAKMRESKRGVEGAVNEAKKFVDKAAKEIGKGLEAVVKVVGPIVADIIPGAGPLIKRGLGLLDDAQKGVQGAIDKVKNIEAAAKAGDPKAKKELDALKASRRVQMQVRGEAPPAPGAVAIDKARLVKEADARGYALLQLNVTLGQDQTPKVRGRNA